MLDEISSGSPEAEAGASHGAEKQVNADLTSTSDKSGAGMLSKLILVGVIVGVIAILLKSRKSNSNALTEKSLA